MGRKKEVSAASRAQEYKSEGFYVHEHGIIMCKFCNTRVEWSRRDSCQKHVLSKVHIDRKLKVENSAGPSVRQAAITNSFAAQENAQQNKVNFIMDTTTMLLKVS